VVQGEGPEFKPQYWGKKKRLGYSLVVEHLPTICGGSGGGGGNARRKELVVKTIYAHFLWYTLLIK
jgi:hypothetical protein